ncbi:MAG: hypothetical protein WC603_02835 [Candidatus Paceibacterota bacterium]
MLISFANVDAFEFEINNELNILESNSLSPDLVKNFNDSKLIKDRDILIETEKTKLENITEKQNFSTGEINKAIFNIKNGSKIKKLLIGNNLKVLNFQLVQIKNLNYSLGIIKMEAKDEISKNQIDTQINFLNDEQSKVEKFILEQKEQFSLFGWFVSSL